MSKRFGSEHELERNFSSEDHSSVKVPWPTGKRLEKAEVAV